MDILSVLITALFLLMASLIGIFIAYARSQRSKSKTEVVRKNLYGERATTRRQMREGQKKLALENLPLRKQALEHIISGRMVRLFAPDDSIIAVYKIPGEFQVETMWERQKLATAQEALQKAEAIFNYEVSDYQFL